MKKQLTIGKLRGLQQLADRAGIFAMCAMDHRDSMQREINPADPDSVPYDTMVQYKHDLVECLAPASTAVLLDPIFGAAQALATAALPGDTALLVSLEESGYERDNWGRVTTLLSDWGADKIKRMGATGAKLLLYYRPDLGENSARQREVVKRVAEDCARNDLPFLLEPLTYPASEAEREPAAFAARKPELVAQSARDLTPLGIDVLKAEFPSDLRFESDEGKLRATCEQLDQDSVTPWVLLSGGITYDEFTRQVKIACAAGASGFLGGRAIWAEAILMTDAAERRHWLATTGVDRLRRLHDLAGAYGRPWWKKWVDAPIALAEVGPDWHRNY